MKRSGERPLKNTRRCHVPSWPSFSCGIKRPHGLCAGVRAAVYWPRSHRAGTVRHPRHPTARRVPAPRPSRRAAPGSGGKGSSPARCPAASRRKTVPARSGMAALVRRWLVAASWRRPFRPAVRDRTPACYGKVRPKSRPGASGGRPTSGRELALGLHLPATRPAPGRARRSQRRRHALVATVIRNSQSLTSVPSVARFDAVARAIRSSRNARLPSSVSASDALSVGP